MIHLFDASNEKMAAKVPDMAKSADILLATLRTRSVEEAAREGLSRSRTRSISGKLASGRANYSASLVVLDDITHAVDEIGEVDATMDRGGGAGISLRSNPLPAERGKGEGRTADHDRRDSGSRSVAEPQGDRDRQSVDAGHGFGAADLAASRRMKTTRVGGGHPGYLVVNDPDPDAPDAPRATAQQDPWHYSIARMVDACTSAGILPFYGPYGDIKDVEGCEAQFRAAFLLGCVGAWSLHPVQIEIAKRVFSPDPEEVKFARKVIEAIPDGRGVHMIDGKMQDDATWKQCKVMVELAEMLAEKDPELKAAYEL